MSDRSIPFGARECVSEARSLAGKAPNDAIALPEGGLEIVGENAGLRVALEELRRG